MYDDFDNICCEELIDWASAPIEFLMKELGISEEEAFFLFGE